MFSGQHIHARIILGFAAIMMSFAASAGCSFLFDFDECKAAADCTQFDEAAEQKFFTCSNANKCVLDTSIECRRDAHCTGSGQTCEESKCVP